MSASRRARIALAASAALFCGGLAASIVSSHERRIRAEVGPLVPALVAAREIPAGKLLTPASSGSLSQRLVPSRFVSPNVLRRPAQAYGFRAAASLFAGDYVTRGALRSSGEEESLARARAGGRLIEVPVSGGAGVLSDLEPGARVDVLITSDRGGPPRTYLALQQAELIAVSTDASGSSSGGGDHPADAVATLRVPLRAAILLTAAQNFAREVRLVPRPDGDQASLPPIEVTASQLQP